MKSFSARSRFLGVMLKSMSRWSMLDASPTILEFAEVMCHDALTRDESCGAHFRVEHQTDQGEAKRNDQHFCSVSAWEYAGTGNAPIHHRNRWRWNRWNLR